MGFVSPEATLNGQLGLEVDQRNNVHAVPYYMIIIIIIIIVFKN